MCGHRDGKGGQNYGNSGQSGHEWTAKGHPWTAEKAGTVWGWCPLGLSFSGGADPARTNSAEMAEGIFLPAPLQKISSSDSAAGGKRLLARSAGGIQRGGGSPRHSASGFGNFAAWMETGATGWLFWRRKVEKVRIFVYTHSDIFGNFRRKGTAA